MRRGAPFGRIGEGRVGLEDDEVTLLDEFANAAQCRKHRRDHLLWVSARNVHDIGLARGENSPVAENSGCRKGAANESASGNSCHVLFLRLGPRLRGVAAARCRPRGILAEDQDRLCYSSLVPAQKIR